MTTPLMPQILPHRYRLGLHDRRALQKRLGRLLGRRSPFSSPLKQLAGRWGGCLILLAGCHAQATVPSVPLPQVEINGLVTCSYANGALTNCALNSGATLDQFANTLLNGTAVTDD